MTPRREHFGANNLLQNISKNALNSSKCCIKLKEKTV